MNFAYITGNQVFYVTIGARNLPQQLFSIRIATADPNYYHHQRSIAFIRTMNKWCLKYIYRYIHPLIH